MFDQNSAEGKALQAAVKLELRNYLGKDYNDDVLPLYIVVMLAHGNQQALVAENLEAFLGQEKATVFAEWLFRHLAENPGKYDTPTLPLEPVQPEPAAAAAADDAEPAPQVGRADESGHKRRRDKREKIEWRVEQAKDSRHAHRDREAGGSREHREEKRRKGSEQERERADRLADGHHRERERERERLPFDRREPEDSRARHGEAGRESRHRLSDRALDRDRRSERHERPRHRDYNREIEDHARHADAWDDRRDGRSTRDRHKEPAIKEPERQLRVSSRLAGRLGEPNAVSRAVPRSRSRSPPPSREEGRPSVFDRLNRLPAEQQEPPHKSRAEQLESKSKMRMDAVAASATAADPEPEPAPATPLQPTVSLGGPDEVASELRQIRETLAKMQAEKVRQVDKVIASTNARKAVVHNVHFNAPPEIVKAHFSGCGNIMSAIIEKDPSGNPRGVAVVEFEEESSRKTALTLSGSMLLGRPVTVYPKETAPQYAPAAFKPRAPAPGSFRPRAPMAGRGRAPGRLPGRGPMPGRTMLKNNKYVRPQAAPEEAKAANGSAAPAAVRS